MMDRLVECVPNFSEGRHAGKVQALVAAVRGIHDVYLLDEEMDGDHHRSVLTFVGTPAAVVEAAFQATNAAAGIIDLRTHQGGHPRVGATDVVPFVPIRGVTMEECIELARSLGERIGRELDIPVFLYERAATRPERVNLEAIRRGGPAGLAERMAADPAWRQDFGPSTLHPTAGATVVGARPPLIAYNVNLQTSDESVAKGIAKTVRFSSGGLPYVKAIGLALPTKGLVQVSMNLTNFEETPVHTAFEAVQREAEQRGVAVAESEVIGLIPQGAVLQTAKHCLKIERFDPTQVLETRLDLVLAQQAGRSGGQSGPIRANNLGSSLTPFLNAVAEGTPTPGGGSVAALGGALACSLGIMACVIGLRPQAEGNAGGGEAAIETSRQRLMALRTRFEALIQADADAFEDVLKAYRVSKSDPERQTAISVSLKKATEVPLETAELAMEVASLLVAVRALAKPSVSSDVKVGMLMAVAAAEGGLENVNVNIKSSVNQMFKSEIADRVRRLERSLVELRGLC